MFCETSSKKNLDSEIKGSFSLSDSGLKPKNLSLGEVEMNQLMGSI
jgi:hypothetical protein